MKHVIRTVAVAMILTLSFAVPALATPRSTVSWVCDVPGEGPVTFVTAAGAARHGINTANDHAGQTFFDRFGEVCTVV